MIDVNKIVVGTITADIVASLQGCVTNLDEDMIRDYYYEKFDYK